MSTQNYSSYIKSCAILSDDDKALFLSIADQENQKPLQEKVMSELQKLEKENYENQKKALTQAKGLLRNIKQLEIKALEKTEQDQAEAQLQNTL